MWHTLPPPPPPPRQLEEKENREFDQDVPFFKQLGPKDGALKKNVGVLAALLEKNHWGVIGSTPKDDLRLMNEYEALYGITLSTDQKRSARNMYTYIARLMTPPEIMEVLYAIGDGKLDPHTFFRAPPAADDYHTPLDKAGLTSYVEHSNPGIFRGGVRRIPTSAKDRSLEALLDGRGLDPSKHWGIEDDGCRELMACCGTPAYGKGSITGCWIQIDKSKELGLIVPYTVLGSTDPWPLLAEHTLLPNKQLEILFLNDVVTGTAFLDAGYYKELDVHIRRRWAQLVPQLVRYYGEYMDVLSDAIQYGTAKPGDPCKVLQVDELFMARADALVRLIYQYNKPQEQGLMLDAKTFLNVHLFKAHSALLNFTGGFVVIDGVKVYLLKKDYAVDGASQLKTFLIAHGKSQSVIALVDLLEKTLRLFPQFAQRHKDVLPFLSDLSGGKGDDFHEAYTNLVSSKTKLQHAINTMLKQMANGDQVLPGQDDAQEMSDAINEFENASTAISTADLEIARAKNAVARNDAEALVVSSTLPAWKELTRLEIEVSALVATKKAALTEALANRLELNASETAQVGELVAKLASAEEEYRQLLLEVDRTKRLLVVLQKQGASAEALATVTATMAVPAITKLKLQLQAVSNLDVEAGVNQVMLAVNARRTEAQKRRPIEAVANVRRARAYDAAAWIQTADATAFFNSATTGLVYNEATQKGLKFLLSEPALSQQERTLLISSKLLTLDGQLPRRFQTGLETIPAIERDKYDSIYFGDNPLSQAQLAIVHTTWRAFVDWLFYRSTTDEKAKWEAFQARLPSYVALVPSQPVLVERKLGQPHGLTVHSSEFDRIIVPDTGGLTYPGRLVHAGQSCWIDSAFVALFSYPRNAVAKEILQATRGQHYVREILFANGKRVTVTGCSAPKMQELHEAIVKDILQLQDAAPASNVCSILAREKWDSCVLGQPTEQGKGFETDVVFESLKVLYELKSLEMGRLESPIGDFVLPVQVPANVVVQDNVMTWAGFTKYAPSLEAFPYRCADPVYDDGAFVLGAVIAGSGRGLDDGHYITYLRDFYLQQWFFIDVVPGRTMVVNAIGPVLPENAHYFFDEDHIKAPVYKPCVYVYFRKSMLIDLIRQKPAGAQQNAALTALGAAPSAPVMGYAAILRALEEQDTDMLEYLLENPRLDQEIIFNMDDILQELDLVIFGGPTLKEFAKALDAQQDVHASTLLNGVPSIRHKDAIVVYLQELGLL